MALRISTRRHLIRITFKRDAYECEHNTSRNQRSKQNRRVLAEIDAALSLAYARAADRRFVYLMLEVLPRISYSLIGVFGGGLMFSMAPALGSARPDTHIVRITMERDAAML